jgi:hypothetical protein
MKLMRASVWSARQKLALSAPSSRLIVSYFLTLQR